MTTNMDNDMAPRPVSLSRTVMSRLVMPNDTNHFGIIHGGIILRMADEAAYVAATRHSGKVCLTASVDYVRFRSSIHVGALVTFYASINLAGTTSMEIGIRVTSEDVRTGKIAHTNSCYFTFVAVDENGRPTPVPPLLLETDEDRRRNLAATKRREARLRDRGGQG